MVRKTKKKSRVLKLLFFFSSSIILIGAGLWFALAQGINFDRINISSVSAKQVRIQLNNGFLITIDQLTVQPEKSTSSQTDPAQFITHYEAWSHLLQEVRINKIHYQDQTYSLLYRDKQFSISADNFKVQTTLAYRQGQIRLRLTNVEIRPYPVTFDGVATFTPANQEISVRGNFNGPVVRGKLEISRHDNQVKAVISTENFTGLAELLSLFHVDQETVSWIADNITAKDYRIEHLELNTVIRDGKPVIRPEYFSGKAVATDAAVRFHPALPPVKSDHIRITYREDKLAFELDRPAYKSKDLTGSKVRIEPLLGNDTHLVIDIRTDSQLDNDIHEILNTYDIHIPLTQNAETTQTDLQLDFELPGFTLQSKGEFTATGDWTCGGVDFQANLMAVRLENNLVFIDKADIDYQGRMPANIWGTVNTTTKQIALKTNIEQIGVQEGELDINFTDPENLTFSGSGNTDILPLTFEGKPVTQFTFQGKWSPEKITATINNDKITFIYSEALTVRLHDYLLLLDLKKTDGPKGPPPPFPITVSGPESIIITDQLSIPTKKFQTKITGPHVTFTANMEQGKILFESNKEGMSLSIKDTDAILAQDFFLFADLEKGKFDLSLQGKDNKNFEGFIAFKNVFINDMMVLNNVLSFLNTIPALATLSSPGFDTDGYHIEEGVAHFTVNGNLLKITQFRTNGVTINTEAEGWIDFENDILKLNLELISLKDYSKIISKIPWAGYVLLGENGSISTSLQLTGNLEDPVITTNLSSEIVMLPVNMVKRTVKWPFLLFDKMKKLAAEEKEDEKQDDFPYGIIDP